MLYIVDLKGQSGHQDPEGGGYVDTHPFEALYKSSQRQIHNEGAQETTWTLLIYC